MIIAGTVGAVGAPAFIKWFHVTDPVAQGLAIGACSHALGTTKAREIGELQGAMSSIAIGNLRSAGRDILPVPPAVGPYGVRRGARRESRACPGGHTGRPYAVFSAWSVGRGAHTPPNRTAGINRPAINAAPPSILS